MAIEKYRIEKIILLCCGRNMTRKVVAIVVEEIRKGKCFVFMKSKLLLWNVRGLNGYGLVEHSRGSP